MIGMVKMLLSQAGIVGMIVGAVAMFIFRPLVMAGINKVIRKNS